MKRGFLNMNLNDPLLALEEVRVAHSGDFVRMDIYFCKDTFKDTEALSRCVNRLNALPEIREIGYFVEGCAGRGEEELEKLHFVTSRRPVLDMDVLSAAFHKVGLLTDPRGTWRDLVANEKSRWALKR